MTPDTIRSAYKRLLQERMAIRRYSGTGAARQSFDTPVKGSASGYIPKDLIGTVQQGEQLVIVNVQDLIDGQFALPVTSNDKVIVNSKELAIVAPIPRNALDGTLIAYALRATG